MFSPIPFNKIHPETIQPSERPIHSPGSGPQQATETPCKTTPKPKATKEKQDSYLKKPKTNYPQKIQQISGPYPKPLAGKSSQ
jgi:hypothetical protein